MKRFALAIDLLFLLLFVGIGRSSHRHGLGIGGLASTLWPFVAGLAVGWLLIRWAQRDATTPINGFIIVVVTVALGMVLRVISGQGTAVSFIIVALVFLNLFLVGWRLLAPLTSRGRKTPTS